MKKQSFLLAAGLFTACIANAQIKKGDVLLGGGLSFTRLTNSPAANDQTSINITPSIGIATKDNQLVGFNLSYTHMKYDNGANGPQTSDAYGAGVFLRRYKPLGSGFALFGEGNFMGSYAYSKNTYYTATGQPTESRGYGFNLGFYPGIAYAISPHAQLETGFQNLFYASYGHSKTKIEGATVEPRSDYFSLGSSFSSTLGGFTVGFKWLL